MSRTVRDRAKKKSLMASRRLRQQAARLHNEQTIVQQHVTGASRARDVTHARVTRRVPR